MELEKYLDLLDFNSYEKRAIIYLSSIESDIARNIYQKAKIPQGRIYSVLNDLIFKGIVTVVPTSPKRYQIKDVKIVLKNYIDFKKEELSEKSEMVEKIVFVKKNSEVAEIPSVNLYTGKKGHMDAVVEFRNKATKELLQIAPRFQGNFASMVSIKNALKRGIKVKLIVLNIDYNNREQIINVLENGGKVKFLQHEGLSFLIKDRKQFVMVVQNYLKNEERVVLTSEHKALCKVFIKTFNDLWKKAKVIRLKDLK